MSNIIKVATRNRLLEGANFEAFESTAKLSRKAWLEKRRQGLGGSDIGKLLFPNKYGGPLTLYLEKVSKDTQDDEGNAYTDYGTILEESLRDTYLPTTLVRNGIKKTAFTINKSPYMYRTKTAQWEIANIDSIIEFNLPVVINGVEIPSGIIGVELKTASFSQAEYWAENQIPDNYYAQVQWYMGVLELEYFLVLVLLDRTPEIRIIRRDDDFINSVKAVAASFWVDNVLAEEPPAANGADLGALLELFPKSQKEQIAEIPELETTLEKYLSIKFQIADLETVKDELEAEIKQSIGSWSGVKAGNNSASWSRWESERFDSKAFKEDHPELAAKYLKTVPGQRLTVKTGKPQEKKQE